MEDKHLNYWRMRTKERIKKTLLDKINKDSQEKINDLIVRHYVLQKTSQYNFVIFHGEIYYLNNEVKYYRRLAPGVASLHASLNKEFSQALKERETAHKTFKVSTWSNYLNIAISRSASANDLKKVLPSFIHGLIIESSWEDKLSDEEAENIKYLHQYGYQALCEQITLNMVLV